MSDYMITHDTSTEESTDEGIDMFIGETHGRLITSATSTKEEPKEFEANDILSTVENVMKETDILTNKTVIYTLFVLCAVFLVLCVFGMSFKLIFPSISITTSVVLTTILFFVSEIGWIFLYFVIIKYKLISIIGVVLYGVLNLAIILIFSWNLRLFSVFFVNGLIIVMDVLTVLVIWFVKSTAKDIKKLMPHFVLSSAIWTIVIFWGLLSKVASEESMGLWPFLVMFFMVYLMLIDEFTDIIMETKYSNMAEVLLISTRLIFMQYILLMVCLYILKIHGLYLIFTIGSSIFSFL